MLNIWKNGNTAIALQSPSKMTVNYYDLDSETTKRLDVSGVMDRTPIRFRVRGISLEFPPLTQAQMATLLNAFVNDTGFTVTTASLTGGTVNGNANFYSWATPYTATGTGSKNDYADRQITVSTFKIPKGFFILEYPDGYLPPTTNSGKYKRIFYVSDRSTPVYNYNSTTNTGLWEGVSFELVEM